MEAVTARCGKEPLEIGISSAAQGICPPDQGSRPNLPLLCGALLLSPTGMVLRSIKLSKIPGDIVQHPRMVGPLLRSLHMLMLQTLRVPGHIGSRDGTGTLVLPGPTRFLFLRFKGLRVCLAAAELSNQGRLPTEASTGIRTQQSSPVSGRSASMHISALPRNTAASQRPAIRGSSHAKSGSMPSLLPSCAVFYRETPSSSGPPAAARFMEDNGVAAQSSVDTTEASTSVSAGDSQSPSRQDTIALALASRWAWSLAQAAGVRLTATGPRLPGSAPGSEMREIDGVGTGAGLASNTKEFLREIGDSTASAPATQGSGGPGPGDRAGGGSRAATALRAMSDPADHALAEMMLARGVGIGQRGGRSASVSPVRQGRPGSGYGLPGLSADTARRLSLRPALEELGWLNVTSTQSGGGGCGGGGVDDGLGGTGGGGEVPAFVEARSSLGDEGVGGQNGTGTQGELDLDWGPFDANEIGGGPPLDEEESMNGIAPRHRPTESAPVSLSAMRLNGGLMMGPGSGRGGAAGIRSSLQGGLQALTGRQQAIDPDWLGSDDDMDEMPRSDGVSEEEDEDEDEDEDGSSGESVSMPTRGGDHRGRAGSESEGTGARQLEGWGGEDSDDDDGFADWGPKLARLPGGTTGDHVSGVQAQTGAKADPSVARCEQSVAAASDVDLDVMSERNVGTNEGLSVGDHAVTLDQRQGKGAMSGSETKHVVPTEASHDKKQQLSGSSSTGKVASERQINHGQKVQNGCCCVVS